MAKLWRVTREISANVMGNEAYLALHLEKKSGTSWARSGFPWSN
jgi:hypothetical protein